MDLEPTQIVSLLVAAIAAASALFTARSANKASVRTTEIESRVDLETEAYNRARKYDTDTIARQDEENAELREINKKLTEEISMLHRANSQLTNVVLENTRLKEEVKTLKRRVRRLEGLPDRREEDDDV